MVMEEPEEIAAAYWIGIIPKRDRLHSSLKDHRVYWNEFFLINPYDSPEEDIGAIKKHFIEKILKI